MPRVPKRGDRELGLELAYVNVDLAWMWARQAGMRLYEAQRIPALAPNKIGLSDRNGAAAAGLIASFLALHHVQELVVGAPWLGSEPLPRAQIDELHTRLVAARNALMHLDDKLFRSVPGFRLLEDGLELIAAPGEEMAQLAGVATRYTWTELDDAAEKIEAWTANLQSRWIEISDVARRDHNVR